MQHSRSLSLRWHAQGVWLASIAALLDLRGATDVSGFDSLAGQKYVPATKRLLLEFKTLDIRPDNTEGMTWGPRLSGGSPSLIFVADDNFNPRQITQFLAFEVRER